MASEYDIAYCPPPDTRRVALDADARQALRLAANRRGLRLKVIARDLGITPHLLARYQCGERRVPITVLEAWRRLLGIRRKE